MFVHCGVLYLDTTNLKGMVSRYKTPTMDKYTNLKGMVSRYKNCVGFLYLDTIPFKLVCLSIVGVFITGYHFF
jgi:hypothetical protein